MSARRRSRSLAGGGRRARAAPSSARGAAPALLERGPAARPRAAAGLVDVLVRLGREGREPGAAERRRLLLAGALRRVRWRALRSPGRCGGVLLARGRARGRSRACCARAGERYRPRGRRRAWRSSRLALADALGGGHSLRGAIGRGGARLDGAAGHELRRAAAELAPGATDRGGARGDARAGPLGAARHARRRLPAPAARRAATSRGCCASSARAIEEQARLEDEVRAATAQARFTGLLVIAAAAGRRRCSPSWPAPGWFAGLWSSFLTAWLVGLALLLQAVAAVLIRRLARVRA